MTGHIGVDISTEMNKKASDYLARNEHWDVEILEQNVLNSHIKSESGDFIIILKIATNLNHFWKKKG